MQKHYSLIHAEKILELVNKTIPENIGENITVSVWSNCREQGFYLQYFNLESMFKSKAIVFAQQRNSDSIIVVPGMMTDFDNTTHMPSETIWENKRFFNEDDEAVEFIVKYFS